MNGVTAMHDAVKSGDIESVKTLLDAKANVNESNNVGWTPLHIAAQDGLRDILEMLVKSGANIQAVTRKGSTADELASRAGHTKVAAYLAHLRDRR